MELPELTNLEWGGGATLIAWAAWQLWPKLKARFLTPVITGIDSSGVVDIEPDGPVDWTGEPIEPEPVECCTLTVMHHYFCLRDALTASESVNAIKHLDSALHSIATGVDVEEEE
jgi:hypothetical protein